MDTSYVTQVLNAILNGLIGISFIFGLVLMIVSIFQYGAAQNPGAHAQAKSNFFRALLVIGGSAGAYSIAAMVRSAFGS